MNKNLYRKGRGAFSYLKVHLIGIGGAGMSALAKLLLQSGAKVSGSDLIKNQAIEELISQGAQFYKGHSKENLENKDLVIYSSAIDIKNIELKEALNLKIPSIQRGEALAGLMRFKRNLIVTGSHGKTTTTALCISLFMKAGRDLSYLLGGKFKDWPLKEKRKKKNFLEAESEKGELFSLRFRANGKNKFKFKSLKSRLNFFEKNGGSKNFLSNSKFSLSSNLGLSQWFITEADESDGTLKYFLPEILIITNVDNEHLEYHQSLLHLKDMLFQLALRLPFHGSLIVCGDDLNLFSLFKPKSGVFSHLKEKKEIQALIEKLNLYQKTLFYGFHDRNTYVLKKMKESEMKSGVRIKGENHRRDKKNFRRSQYAVFREQRKLFSFTPSLPGDTNALNSLASILAGLHSGISDVHCIENVETFVGVQRRMDYIGQSQGIDFFDDYGHHPTEIKALLKAFREAFPEKRLVVLFQPHRFSRTKLCWDDFLNCFHEAHKIFVLDIFSGGEDSIPGIHAKVFCEEHKRAKYLPEKNVLGLRNELKAGDIFLTLGAGDVRKWGESIYKDIKSSSFLKDNFLSAPQKSN